MSIDVTLESLLPEMLAELDAKVAKALDTTAAEVAEMWQSNVRVDTGAFRDSIHTETPDAHERIIADGVPYGIFNELGSRTIAAKPDLTLAMVTGKERLAERLEDAFKP